MGGGWVGEERGAERRGRRGPLGELGAQCRNMGSPKWALVLCSGPLRGQIKHESLKSQNHVYHPMDRPKMHVLFDTWLYKKLLLISGKLYIENMHFFSKWVPPSFLHCVCHIAGTLKQQNGSPHILVNLSPSLTRRVPSTPRAPEQNSSIGTASVFADRALSETCYATTTHICVLKNGTAVIHSRTFSHKFSTSDAFVFFGVLDFSSFPRNKCFLSFLQPVTQLSSEMEETTWRKQSGPLAKWHMAETARHQGWRC